MTTALVILDPTDAFVNAGQVYRIRGQEEKRRAKAESRAAPAGKRGKRSKDD